MLDDIKDVETGRVYEGEVSQEKVQRWTAMQDETKNSEHYVDWIDNTDLNANLKNLLKAILEKTVVVGKQVLEFGKFVLDKIVRVFGTYPRATGGALLGFFIGTIISTVPFVGWLLGPLFTPILTALGGLAGCYADLVAMCGQKTVVQVQATAKEAF